jgi:hypothetical protein
MPTLNRNVIDMGQAALLTHLIRLTMSALVRYDATRSQPTPFALDGGRPEPGCGGDT